MATGPIIGLSAQWPLVNNLTGFPAANVPIPFSPKHPTEKLPIQVLATLGTTIANPLPVFPVLPLPLVAAGADTGYGYPISG